MNKRTKELIEILRAGRSWEVEAADLIEELTSKLISQAEKPKLDKKEIINRMAEHLREQKAAQDLKDHEFKAKGLCPVCKGTGELGGQFTGGTWTCEDCNGTGKYHAETY